MPLLNQACLQENQHEYITQEESLCSSSYGRRLSTPYNPSGSSGSPYTGASAMTCLWWLAGIIVVLALLNMVAEIWYGAKLIEHERKRSGYYDEH